MRPRRFPLFFSALLLVAACDCGDGDPSGTPCTTSSDCPTAALCVDGTCRPRDTGGEDGGAEDAFAVDAPGAMVTEVRIDPPMADLVIAPGEMATVDFDLLAVYSDGSTQPVLGAEFTLDTIASGLVDPANGVFTTNGAAAGSATVTGTASIFGTPYTATAPITVRIEQVILAEGVPADVADQAQVEGPLDQGTDGEARVVDSVGPLDCHDDNHGQNAGQHPQQQAYPDVAEAPRDAATGCSVAVRDGPGLRGPLHRAHPTEASRRAVYALQGSEARWSRGPRTMG